MNRHETTTRILLARHAETSDPNRFHGAESDIGLSALGREQAERLAEWIARESPSAVYCSAMRRAVDTAGPIGRASGLEPIVIPELHERRIGSLSGAPREEGWATYAAVKERWIAGDLTATHPGAESFAEIRARVVPILEGLADRHRGRTIAVVAHGVVIRVAIASLAAGYAPADFDRIKIEFASANDVHVKDGRWEAAALNHVVAPSESRPVA